MDSPGAVAAPPSGHQVRVIESQPRQNFRPRNTGGEIVQDLINSFVRLSAAMTVYSLQQMQSAADTIDAKDSVAKLKKMIDSMTDALTAQIDESKKKTMESISNLGTDVVERTFETLNKPTEIVRKTTDSLANIMKSDKTDDKKHAAGKHKPKAAEEVLVSHSH
jgi:hypothetical protein